MGSYRLKAGVSPGRYQVGGLNILLEERGNQLSVRQAEILSELGLVQPEKPPKKKTTSSEGDEGGDAEESDE